MKVKGSGDDEEHKLGTSKETLRCRQKREKGVKSGFVVSSLGDWGNSYATKCKGKYVRSLGLSLTPSPFY